MSVIPFSPTTQGTDRKTGCSTPWIPYFFFNYRLRRVNFIEDEEIRTWTKVDTANTLREFFKMALVRIDTLKPIAQEV